MLAAGCASQPRDYASYRAHLPRSVLVLPPLNQSVEVDAPYRYLSTISRPLAEAGYYVFPVAVVDGVMKENGLPTPGEMHAVSLEKIREVFGADAVLYVTIEDYGQKYLIVLSGTVVKPGPGWLTSPQVPRCGREGQMPMKVPGIPAATPLPRSLWRRSSRCSSRPPTMPMNSPLRPTVR
jgi:hypothetical protein